MKTCAEFPMYIPYSNNYRSLARKFAVGIEVAAQSLEAPGIRDHLQMQKDYVNRFYIIGKQKQLHGLDF
jgi:hypothetical protein